jgi:hypothetical protein
MLSSLIISKMGARIISEPNPPDHARACLVSGDDIPEPSEIEAARDGEGANRSPTTARWRCGGECGEEEGGEGEKRKRV